MEAVFYQDRLAHDTVVQRLWRLWRNNRFPQALLLAGPDQAVTRASAGRLIKAMVCEAVPRGPQPCRRCGPCRRLAKGRHPDVIWDQPPDETGVWGIETVRSWMSRLALTPYEGERVILVVDQAHRMSHQAASAFLKTLEESPPHAVIVLLTDVPERLLVTIRSRCTPVRVPALSRCAAARILVEQGMGPRQAVVAAGMSEGSLQSADAGSEASWVRIRDQIIDNRRAAGNNDTVVKTVTSDAETTRRVLRLVLSLTRDLWVGRAGARPRHWIHVDRPDAVSRMMKADVQTLDDLTRDVVAAFRQIQEQLNVKIPVRLILDRLWTI